MTNRIPTMASRVANHEHRWRIIAHTVTKSGKAFRALLGCDANFRCPAAKIVQPKQNRKHDEEFWGKIAVSPHVCCQQDLRQYQGTEAVSAA